MHHVGLLERMEIINNKIQNPSPKGVYKLECHNVIFGTFMDCNHNIKMWHL